MKVLTEQAELAFGEGEEARPCGSSVLKHSSDGLAVPRRGLRSVVTYVATPLKLPIVICHSRDLTQSC